MEKIAFAPLFQVICVFPAVVVVVVVGVVAGVGVVVGSSVIFSLDSPQEATKCRIINETVGNNLENISHYPPFGFG